MNYPEFPKNFYAVCPKVAEAKHWHKQLKVEEDNLEIYAECALIDVTFGKKCENCSLFLSRTEQKVLFDEVESFYLAMDNYHDYLKGKELAMLDNGAGI